MKCVIWWRLLAVLTALSAPAAASAATKTDFSLRPWQSDDGLPNNTVNGIAQTRDGFLWLATPSRLAQFDGVRFENFDLTRVGAGPNQTLTTLLADRAGALWLAFAPASLVRMNGGEVRVFTNGWPDLSPQSMVEDNEGAFWITFNRGTLCRWKNGEVKQFGEADGWPNAAVASVASDKEGRVWFAKASQAGWFTNGHFETLARLPRPVGRVTPARDGGVWVASGRQLFRLTPTAGLSEAVSFPADAPDAEPTAILEDHAGAVWIGTKANGLFHFANGEFQSVPTSHREILSLAEDREGNLWVGTAGGGLNRLRPRAIEWQTSAIGLPFDTLRSICEDGSGTVWAATENGLLLRHDGDAWKAVPTEVEGPGGQATCVAADADGGVWIGSAFRTVHHWREGGFTRLRQADGLMGRTTQGLLVSKGGDVWIAQTVADGLQRLRAGKLSTLALPANVRVIQAMAEDTNGILWLGTSRGKLLRVEGDEVADASQLTTSIASPIRALRALADGSLWLGYGGAGLGWLKNGRFALIGTDQGLFNQNISQIVEDDRGWIWFGSDHGLFKVRRAELEAVAEGRAARVRSVRYGRDDGLESLQANFGNSPTATRTRDGRIWMPMRTGLAVISPEKLPDDLKPPPVQITRMTVDERPVSTRILPPGHRRIDIEFTAPTFAAPQNVNFRYRLEDFDDHWIECGTERHAVYSRLTAGNYRLAVQSCNSLGQWSDTPATLPFFVAPFFWQTWWFRMTALVVFTSGVAGIVRQVSHRRLKAKLRAAEQQAALERERARIARDIHDDLGNRLTKITLLSGLAQRDANKSAAHVTQISDTVRQATDALDEIVWAINPRNDTLPQLIDYLGQFAVDFLRTAGVRCEVDLPDHPPTLHVPAEVRHNVFLVVKESLTNIVHHAQATEVQLRVVSDEKSGRVFIADNGRGFSANGKGEERNGSDGLKNMRQRMSEIGGQLEIDSTPGKGTRILLQFPWLKN